jgi:dTDP-4-amino-4,6-dideoxygalactose transaminase
MAATSLASPAPITAISRFLIPDLPSASEVLPYLRQLDEARWYSNFGPLVCEFEEKLQRLLARADRTPGQGSIYLTTLVSGHHALEVALHLIGITRGKKVLLPAVTFPACPLSVQHTGAEAVLADIDPATWTLTPDIARAAAARHQIDAVMPVALYGVPLPVAPWDEFSRETGIPVVIDAAAAVEVQQVPQLGVVAHSLHATKPLGVGEGGILVSRDSHMVERARRYSNFGTSERICHMDGSNIKMSEYHAAVGLAQLNRWDAVKQRRGELLSLYLQHLGPLRKFLSVQPNIDAAVVSLFVLLFTRSSGDSVMRELGKRGVSTHRSYFPPLYRHPHFANAAVSDVNGGVLSGAADVETKQEHMVNSESMFARVVGVPFHSFMSEPDLVTVVEEVRRLVYDA